MLPLLNKSLVEHSAYLSTTFESHFLHVAV